MTLRERKKQATREALRTAALRLARAKGPENVRVDEIAEAAGVSPRTYNNYFPSREHAIVAGIVAARELRADGDIVEAVIEYYTDAPGDGMLMIATNPALRNCYVETATGIEAAIEAALAGRGIDKADAEVLAAALGAAAKVALRRWLQPATVAGLVVVSGSLPEIMRAALAPLTSAVEAAAQRSATSAGGSGRPNR